MVLARAIRSFMSDEKGLGGGEGDRAMEGGEGDRDMERGGEWVVDDRRGG